MKPQIESIDILCGVVMILMALDHVRDYFRRNANVNDPLNLTSTAPPLYFTRWTIPFCTPVSSFKSIHPLAVALLPASMTTGLLGIHNIKKK